MAYTVIKTEQGANAGNGYYTEYLCESVDDIATLPTEVEYGGPRPGSLALLEDGTVYILKNSREWSEFSMAGGGGGSGSGGYDAVIKIQYDWDEKTYSAELVSGSYDAVQKKLQAGTFPAVEGFVESDSGGLCPINVAFVGGNEDEIVICFESSTLIPGAGFVCYLTADSIGVDTEDTSWAKYAAVISVNTSVSPKLATVQYGEFEVVKQLALSGAPMNIAVVESDSSTYDKARTYSVEAELSNYIAPTHGEYYIAIHATCGMGHFGEFSTANLLIVWYEDGTVTIEDFA